MSHTLSAHGGKLVVLSFVRLDQDRKVYGAYGLFTLPMTAIIDQHGDLAYEYSSYGRDFEQKITGKAKVLLGFSTEEEFEKKTAWKEIDLTRDEENEAQKNLQMAKVLLKKGAKFRRPCTRIGMRSKVC